MIKKLLNIKILFILVLLFRLLISNLPPMEIDQGLWRFWSARMVEVGPMNFYSPKVFTDNPPGFLYVFWFLGELKKTFLPKLSYFSPGFDFLLKFPNNLADLLTGLIIYVILKKKVGKKWAMGGFLAYTLNPAVFFNSSIFGQFDASGTFFMLLAIYLLLIKKQPELSALSFAFAWAIKPQAIALAPALGLLVLLTFPVIKWLTSGLTFFLSTLIIYLPFFPDNPLYGIFYVQDRMTKIFTCTSCFTFNFWGIFGNWQNDLNQFLGLPLMQWGIILLFLSFIPIFFWRPFRLRFRQPYVYLTIALSIFAFFTFATRMHERYLFPFFAFLLVGALLLKSRPLLAFYGFLSLFNTLNVYYPYAYYNKHLGLTPGLLTWLGENFKTLSLIGFLSFIILGYSFYYIYKQTRKK